MLFIFSLLLATLPITLPIPHDPLPVPLDSLLNTRAANKPSATESRCFYDYGCESECTSSPEQLGCPQSIAAVCAAVASTPASGKATWWFYATHSPPIVSPSYNTILNAETIHNADCIAMVRVSAILSTYPTIEQCTSAFETLKTCADFRTQNFNGSCVGGSRNVKFCDEEQGTLVDKREPAYLLGTSDELNVVPGANGTHDLSLTAPVGKEGVLYQEVYDGTVSGPVGAEKLRQGETGPR